VNVLLATIRLALQQPSTVPGADEKSALVIHTGGSPILKGMFIVLQYVAAYVSQALEMA
jgi:hypothetical protein